MKQYFEKKIVCLGGGIGTVNLVRGLKKYTHNIAVIVSMADDGGSAGRLRRFFSIPPPGDLVSCIAALSNSEPLMRELLTYRFSGNRYGSDHALPGQKLGNLILVALTSITGDFNKALLEMQRIFKISGKIIPSTLESVSIMAKTSTGEEVQREENIDLGRFKGEIEQLFLMPQNPTAPKQALLALQEADVIVAGPGDLYTTILPVLLVPEILKGINNSKAKKFFIVNVANKSFETPHYTIDDYIQAIIKHTKTHVFDHFLVNNNISGKIPQKHTEQYSFVPPPTSTNSSYDIIEADLIDESFPLYHSSEKLAKTLLEHI